MRAALSAQCQASASPRLALRCPVHVQCQPTAGTAVPSVGPAGQSGAPLASATTIRGQKLRQRKPESRVAEHMASKITLALALRGVSEGFRVPLRAFLSERGHLICVWLAMACVTEHSSAQCIASVARSVALRCPSAGQCRQIYGTPVPSVGPVGRPAAPLASASCTVCILGPTRGAAKTVSQIENLVMLQPLIRFLSTRYQSAPFSHVHRMVRSPSAQAPSAQGGG